MILKKILFLVFVALFVSTANSQISAPKFGDGLLNFVGKDSTFSVRFAPRIQMRAGSIWVHDGDKFGEGVQDFVIRRARLKFDGFAYSPKLRYKFQLGLSNPDIAGASEFTGNAPLIIYDAVVMWEFYENLELWAGQANIPGNREQRISSGNLQFIDRSRLNSLFNLGRELGVQLHHKFEVSENFIIREMFAVSQGEGRNVTTGNLGGLQYTGRVEILPFGEFTKKGDYIGGDIYREKTPKLSIAASYDLNADAVKTRSNAGSYMRNDIGFYETNITTVFVDAMFKYNGFSLMGEYSYRDASNPIATNSDGSITEQEVYTGQGLNLQGGYVFKSNWEIAGRFTTIMPDTNFSSNETQNQFVLGGSKYIVGHKLKVQTDLVYGTVGGESGFLEYTIGFDLHF
jgi:phosphate-selective porin OprO/OprP